MKLRLFLAALFAVALAVGTAGCGDDDDSGNGGSCGGTFQACGGEATGTWTSTVVCNPEVDFQQECPSASIRVTSNRSSATIVLGSDGNYSREETVDYDYSANVPSECTEGAPCAAVGAFVGGTCTDATGGCSCSGTVFGTTSVTGTWETEGTDLVLDLGTADEDRIAYCVEGNTGSTLSSDGLRINWSR